MGSDEGAEDVEMGLCLQNVGVLSADSRDNMGKFRWAAGRGGRVIVTLTYVLMFCNIFSAQVPPIPTLAPPEPAAVARPRLLVLALPQTSRDAGQQTDIFVLTS